MLEHSLNYFKYYKKIKIVIKLNAEMSECFCPKNNQVIFREPESPKNK